MIRLWLAALTITGLAVAAAAHAQGTGSPTLDAVRSRGQLVCGTGGQTVGFSLVDSKGNMTGLDADGCRELAAAVLGDASKVKFVPLTSVNRFTALQAGEVDVRFCQTSRQRRDLAGEGSVA
jgi:general L-amino acid transport system substrate-binding protein